MRQGLIQPCESYIQAMHHWSERSRKHFPDIKEDHVLIKGLRPLASVLRLIYRDRASRPGHNRTLGHEEDQVLSLLRFTHHAFTRWMSQSISEDARSSEEGPTRMDASLDALSLLAEFGSHCLPQLTLAWKRRFVRFLSVSIWTLALRLPSPSGLKEATALSPQWSRLLRAYTTLATLPAIPEAGQWIFSWHLQGLRSPGEQGQGQCPSLPTINLYLLLHLLSSLHEESLRPLRGLIYPGILQALAVVPTKFSPSPELLIFMPQIAHRIITDRVSGNPGWVNGSAVLYGPASTLFSHTYTHSTFPLWPIAVSPKVGGFYCDSWDDIGPSGSSSLLFLPSSSKPIPGADRLSWGIQTASRFISSASAGVA